MSLTSRNWAMILHFSCLLNCFLPPAGLIAPILIWQLKKEEMPEIEEHGKMVTNFVLSLLIYSAVVIALVCTGIGVLLALPLWIISLVFPILGGIKANEGTLWNYPLTLRLIK